MKKKIREFLDNKTVRVFANFFHFVVVAFSLFAVMCSLFDYGVWFLALIIGSVFIYELVCFFKKNK